MDSLRPANNAIVVCPAIVKIPAAIRTHANYIRMPHVRRENVAIYRHVNTMTPVSNVVHRRVNVICPNIVTATVNFVPRITSKSIRSSAKMAKRIAIMGCANHVMTNANCCGDHRANRRSNAMKRIWMELDTAIAATIVPKKSTKIAAVRIYFVE